MAKAAPIPATVPDAPLAANAALPLLTRLDEVMQTSERVEDPANMADLHAMRIAVKRLRYTLEVFAPAIEGADGFLETLKRLQDLLGEIHDADVLAPLLRKEMQRDGSTAGVQALLDRTEADRRDLYARFLETWHAALSDHFPGRLRSAAFSGAFGLTLSLREHDADAHARETALCLVKLAAFPARSAGTEARERMEEILGEMEEAIASPDKLRRASKRLAKWIRREVR